MRTTLIGLVFFVVVIAISSCKYDIQECRNEKSTRLDLPLPVSQWVKVACVDGGHIIAPTEKYEWSIDGKKGAYLNANGYSNFSSVAERVSDGELISSHMEKLHTYQIDNLNKSLSKILARQVKFNEIYAIRVFSDFKFAYDLMVYIDDEKHPVYIKVCLDYCHVNSAEVIEVDKRVR